MRALNTASRLQDLGYKTTLSNYRTQEIIQNSEYRICYSANMCKSTNIFAPLHNTVSRLENCNISFVNLSPKKIFRFSRWYASYYTSQLDKLGVSLGWLQPFRHLSASRGLDVLDSGALPLVLVPLRRPAEVWGRNTQGAGVWDAQRPRRSENEGHSSPVYRELRAAAPREIQVFRHDCIEKAP